MLTICAVTRIAILFGLIIVSINSTLAATGLVKAGGFGGNPKNFYTYDGQHHPSLDIMRDDEMEICSMQNDAVIVRDWNKQLDGPAIQFACHQPNERHGNIYWNGIKFSSQDFNNPASRIFIMSNDALYYASMTNKMFQDWFQQSALLDENQQPMKIIINIHPVDRHHKHIIKNDADWDSKQAVLGDGDGINFYPFTTSTFLAHEIAHGFTEQHSNVGHITDSTIFADPKSNPCVGKLRTLNQAAAVNESFSDMTSQALQFYLTGDNNWKIAAENTIKVDAARYMNDPPLDCKQTIPGAPKGCSIDNLKDMEKLCALADRNTHLIEIHYLSGVFNKAFYLLSTAPTWDTKKAYTIMTLANHHFWKSDSDFSEAACGVIKATAEYGRKIKQDSQNDILVVKDVFSKVGVDTSLCEIPDTY